MEMADGVHRFGTRTSLDALAELNAQLLLPATASPGATGWPRRWPTPAAAATGDQPVQATSTLAPPLNRPSWSSTRETVTDSGTS